MDTDQTTPKGTYCLLPLKIQSEMHLNICSRSKKQMTFSEQKNRGRKRDAAGWIGGRVLDPRLRGWGLEAHWRNCI